LVWLSPTPCAAHYYGLTGDGHIGKLNVTHAFYQALGFDTRNPFAASASTSNAQMALSEVSWIAIGCAIKLVLLRVGRRQSA